MMTATPPAVPKDEQRSVIQFLRLENVSGSEIQMRMCMVYGKECYHKINCESMGKKIQGGTSKYEGRTLKWLTIKKDLAWYATGIRKFIALRIAIILKSKL